MKRDAASQRPAAEDTFVPELEEQEAQLELLMTAVKAESSRRIQEAEVAAERMLAEVRRTLSSETAEEKRKRLLAALEAIRKDSADARNRAERSGLEARKRIAVSADALVGFVLAEAELE